MKSRAVALMLCFLFGYVGAHKFYLGNTKTGIFFVIMFLTGFGLFITIPLTLLDFIFLLVMGSEKFDKKYNKLTVT